MNSVTNIIKDAYANNWKRKNWNNFCKQVMEVDKRFHLVPIKDWYKASYADIENGTVFGPFYLTMDGDYCPIDVAFLDNTQGLRIETGCSWIKCNIGAYHSKSLVWPVIRICEELNRQYTRMVERAITVQKINTKVTPKNRRHRSTKATV